MLSCKNSNIISFFNLPNKSVGKRMVTQIGCSNCFSYFLCLVSFCVVSKLGMAFQEKFWKPPYDLRYRLASSNVNAVKEMCSGWYRSQFRKTEKAWIQVKILCLGFPKIRGNEYIKLRKVATVENLRFFLTYVSHT